MWKIFKKITEFFRREKKAEEEKKEPGTQEESDDIEEVLETRVLTAKEREEIEEMLSEEHWSNI